MMQSELNNPFFKKADTSRSGSIIIDSGLLFMLIKMIIYNIKKGE